MGEFLVISVIPTVLCVPGFLLCQVMDSNGSVMVLAADSEEEVTAWMQALCMAASGVEVKKGKVTNVTYGAFPRFLPLDVSTALSHPQRRHGLCCDAHPDQSQPCLSCSDFALHSSSSSSSSSNHLRSSMYCWRTGLMSQSS